MDINCSGYNYDPYGGQSWCDDGLDSLRWTRFDDIVARYQNGGPGLSPYIHSFITFGNFGTKKGYVPFDPQSVGIEPLSIMAVVCGDKLVSRSIARALVSKDLICFSSMEFGVMETKMMALLQWAKRLLSLVATVTAILWTSFILISRMMSSILPLPAIMQLPAFMVPIGTPRLLRNFRSLFRHMATV